MVAQIFRDCPNVLASCPRTLLLEKTNIERIPESIIQISELTYLHLSYCERLQSLPKLPFLVRWLDVDDCMLLQSLSGIVEDARQRIQLMAAAHWKEVHEKIDFYMNGGQILLPGSEIPKWFEFQNVGSFVTLVKPPDSSNNNRILGFAFSAIVAFSDGHVDNDRRFSFSCEFKLKTKDCDPHVTRRFLKRLAYVESDHPPFGCYFFSEEDFNGFWRYNCVPEEFHLFFDEFDRFPPLECKYCGVKKCGVRLLYIPDSTDSIEVRSKCI